VSGSVVAEIRANRGDFEFIDHVASKVPPDARILLLQSRASWWRGDFNKCRMFAVRASRCLNVNTARVELELAIADFFEGVWDISLGRLLDVEQSELASGQDIGWARMLAGTVYGLTGRDIDKGKQYLYSAIVLLEDCSDICGLAIAYGNLGEVYWKSGEYEQALKEVLEGRSFATRAGMKLNLVESKRNELHIVIRTEGAHSERAEQLLGELREHSRQQLGAMVEMQLFNSMATAHLYRGELDLAGECIEAARCLTEGNAEYQIYTLVNSGFLHAVRGNSGLAERELVEAVRLAREGHNLLALRQAKHDLEYIVHTPAAKKVRQMKGFLDSIIEGGEQMNAEISVSHENAVIQAFVLGQLAENLQKHGLIVPPETVNDSKGAIRTREGVTALVVAILGGVAAAAQIAQIVFDVVTRKKVSITITFPHGESIRIDSSHQDAESVAKVIEVAIKATQEKTP
jgi:tetratricopeptide (TPR) repeat protein